MEIGTYQPLPELVAVRDVLGDDDILDRPISNQYGTLPDDVSLPPLSQIETVTNPRMPPRRSKPSLLVMVYAVQPGARPQIKWTARAMAWDNPLLSASFRIRQYSRPASSPHPGGFCRNTSGRPPSSRWSSGPKRQHRRKRQIAHAHPMLPPPVNPALYSLPCRSAAQACVSIAASRGTTSPHAKTFGVWSCRTSTPRQRLKRVARDLNLISDPLLVLRRPLVASMASVKSWLRPWQLTRPQRQSQLNRYPPQL